MKLYKYISFKNNYWSEPLTEKMLYLSSVDELRRANDKEEFDHLWDSSSYFFSKYGHELKSRYVELFSAARVLCMGRWLSRRCWRSFCPEPEGGVCYEFIFDESKKKKDLTSRFVEYSDEKIYNVPDFVTKNVSGQRIKLILAMNGQFAETDQEELISWLDSDDPRAISGQHIVSELTFKKVKKYSYEKEYRYIHPEKPIESKVTKLIASKLDFSSLGLTLNRVYTSDVEKVKAKCAEENMRIIRPSFLF